MPADRWTTTEGWSGQVWQGSAHAVRSLTISAAEMPPDLSTSKSAKAFLAATVTGTLAWNTIGAKSVSLGVAVFFQNNHATVGRKRPPISPVKQGVLERGGRCTDLARPTLDAFQGLRGA